MNEYAKQYVAHLRDDRGETVTGGELMELQQLAPRLWSELRKWLQSTCQEINRYSKSDTLNFELSGPEEVRVSEEASDDVTLARLVPNKVAENWNITGVLQKGGLTYAASERMVALC